MKIGKSGAFYADNANQYLKHYIHEDSVSGCHIMQKSAGRNGYVMVNRTKWGKQHNVTMAHQLSYILFNGDYDRNLNINHKCSNKICINPSHLYAGTQKENMKDKCNINNQHRPKGESNGMSKLTEEKVTEIKLLLKTKSLVEIATMFDVCRQHIGDIKNGKRWKHV